MRTAASLCLLAFAVAAADPLLTLDYRGGYGPPRATAKPYVSVHADGTVHVPDRAGKGAGWTMKIGADDVAELRRLGAAVLGFDRKAVERDMAQAMGPVRQMIEDAADTVVTVALDGKRATASFNALDYWAGRYPKIEPLQRLAAVARRLDRLMHVARAGGPERAAAALKLANAALRKENAKARLLEAAHLRGVGIARDGTRTLRFYRYEDKTTTSVTVEVSAEGKLTASVESAG